MEAEMNDVEKFEMIRAMERFGGSFIRALAECFNYADFENTNRLLRAFPEYVKQYTEMAKKMAKKMPKTEMDV
jgi:hypothetical protein